MLRMEAAGHARYLTFSCFHRLPLLNNEQIRALFVDRLKTVCDSERVDLLAWVIMPEHIHLLVLPEGMPDLKNFTHALKRPIAEQVIRRWKLLDAPILKKITRGNGYRYWQAGGGYDRNIFNPAEVREKIDYIHNNPIRRGLVDSATDYAWSSARYFAGCPDFKLECKGVEG